MAKRKVRIKALPKAKEGLNVDSGSGLSSNYHTMPWNGSPLHYMLPELQVRDTLQPVPREFANLEAEKGEQVVVPGQAGIPMKFGIGGQRHYKGGTPLRLPDHSFVYSDTKSMKIKDPAILAQFGMSVNKKGGFTPAEIAKKYNLNQYHKLLMSPNSTDMQRHTAEMMIQNYNLQLAKLAMIQESLKGFPDGLPTVAMPYMEHMGVNPEELFTERGGEQQQEMMAKYGGNIINKVINNLPKAIYGNMGDEYGLDPITGEPIDPSDAFSTTDGRTFNNPSRDATIGEGPGISGRYEWKDVWKEKMGLNRMKLTNTALAGMKGLTNIFNADERRNALNFQDEHFDPNYNFLAVNMTPGDYDQFGNLRPRETGEDAVARYSGYNMQPTFSQKGGQKRKVRVTGLPKFQTEGEKMMGHDQMQQMQDAMSSDWLNFLYQMATQPANQIPKPVEKPKFEVAMSPDRDLDDVPEFEGLPGGIRTVEDLQYYPTVTSRFGPEIPTAFGKVWLDATKRHLEEKINEKNKSNASSPQWPMQSLVWNSETQSLMENDPRSFQPAIDVDSAALADSLKAAALLQKYGLKKHGGEHLPKFQGGGQRNATEERDYDYAIKKIENLLKDKDFVDALWDQYTKELDDTSHRGRNVTQAMADKAKGLTKKEVVANILKMQKGNYLLRSKGYDLSSNEHVDWDEHYKYVDSDGNIVPKGTPGATAIDAGRNWKDKYIFNTVLNRPDLYFDDDVDLLSSQAAFNAIADVIDADPKWEQNYGQIWVATGKADENRRNAGYVSMDDTYAGNTYRGQILFGTEEPDTPQGDEETEGDGYFDIPMAPQRDWGYQDMYAPWWLQDNINVMKDLGDLWRLEADQPWQPPTNVHLPEMPLYDPKRELAESSEIINQGIRGFGAFAGPQMYAANAANMMSQGFRNAANVLGKYNNMNVGQLAQHENVVSNILNRAEEMGTASKVSLYDKYKTVKQQFKNAKTQARDNLFADIVQGVTNAANAQAMNTVYENYQIDPATGGLVYMPSGRPIEPDPYSESMAKANYVRDVFKNNPWLKETPDAAKYIFNEMDTQAPATGLTPEQEMLMRNRYPILPGDYNTYG